MSKAVYVVKSDSQYVDITPTMTSNTAPSGYVASASSEISSPRQAWNAFDSIEGDDGEKDRWHSGANMPQWLMLKFPEPKKVVRFSVLNCSNDHQGINEFTLQGSNNGSTFDDLGEYTNPGDLGALTGYDVRYPGEYQYYRLYIKSSRTTSNGKFYAVIDQVRFYEAGNSTTGGRTRKANKLYGVLQDITRKMKKGYVVAGKLPGGYTQLEYVECNGYSYIDTGWAPANGDTFAVETSLPSGTAESGFAGRSGPLRQWELYYKNRQLLAWASDSKISTLQTVSGNVTYNQKNMLVVRFNADYQDATAYLGVYRTDKYPFYGRIYSAVAQDSSGAKIRDFVPCKNADGVVGFYDRVTAAFFQKVGSNDFTAGGVVKSTTRLFYRGTLGAYSWEEIAEIAASGEAANTWKIGDTKTVMLDGEEYTFRIADFDHDDLNPADARYNDSSYNGGKNKAAITFEMAQMFNTRYCMNDPFTNVGGWDASYMRSTVMPMMKGYMSTELQNVLRTVSKLTSEGNMSSTITTSADQLFLLSEVEVLNTNVYSVAGEGSQYAYYKAGNSVLKKINAHQNYSWWMRSPVPTNGSSFAVIYSDGRLTTYTSYINTVGVSFAFCI